MKVWLTAALLASAALRAEAQVTVGVGGGSWGTGGSFGTGYGIGWGGGSWSSSSWGVTGVSVAGSGYGLYYSGPGYVWSGGGSAVATGVVARDLTPGWHPWVHPAYRYSRTWRRPIPSYVPPPPVGASPPAPALPSTALEEGKRRFRLGDYRAAVDLFREALVADAKDAVAEAHFALGLAVTGDHRNADKALRSAVSHGFAERIDVVSLLRDERERQKLLVALGKAPSSSLAVAWALAGMGKPERLEALAESDADAKRLAKAGK